MDLELESSTTAGENTVEIELTPEQQLGLSRAAEAAQAAACPMEPKIGLSEPVRENAVYRRTLRVDAICNAAFAAALVGTAVGMVWHTASLPTRASAIPARVAVASAPIVQAPPIVPAPAPSQRPLVYLRNPFDKTEVFEFRSETTESQAREAMAELLAQRARDRFAQGLILRHAGSRHGARGAAGEKPQILVTRRSGTVD